MKQALLLLLLGIQLSATATNYYVKNGGNDTLSGTSDADAWETIDKINNFTFRPSDSILLKRGDEWNELLTFDKARHAGAPGNDVVFSNYGSGDLPVLSGYKHYTGWEVYDENIYYVTGAYMAYGLILFDNTTWASGTVDDITDLDADYEYYDKVTWPYGGTDDTLFVCCSDAIDTTNVIGSTLKDIVRGYDVHDITMDGIHITYADYSAISFVDTSWNITIKNCTVDWIGLNGIYINTTNTFTIYNNTIENIGSDGMALTYSDRGNVYSNTIQYCGRGNTLGDRQATGMWYASNIDYHDNSIIHDGYGSVIEASSSWGDFAQENVNFFNNNITTHINGKGVLNLFAGNFDIYNNVIVSIDNDLNKGALVILGGEYDKTPMILKVYNNTFIGSGRGCIGVTTDGEITGNSSFAIKNNIFYNSGRYLNIHSALKEYLESDYNLFYDDNFNISDWQSSTGEDANSIIGDPLFTNAAEGDYTLSSLSPAIDTGIYVGIILDHDGNPRDGKPDIGAFEFTLSRVDPLTNLDSLNDIDFYLYPNPNDGRFTIAFSALQTVDKYSITITDLAGRTIYTETLSYENIFQIDISNFAPGAYIFIFTNGNTKIAYKKFIKV